MTEGKRHPITTFPAEWLPLIHAVGGVEELARAVGVHSRTLRRWARGEVKMRKPNRTVVEALAEKYKVDVPGKGEGN